MDCVKRQVSSLNTIKRALMFLAIYNLTRQRWTCTNIKNRTLFERFSKSGIRTSGDMKCTNQAKSPLKAPYALLNRNKFWTKSGTFYL